MIFLPDLGKPQKSYFLNGQAIKENIYFFLLLDYFILLPFKNKNYFTIDKLLKYGHIILKFVARYF